MQLGYEHYEVVVCAQPPARCVFVYLPPSPNRYKLSPTWVSVHWERGGVVREFMVLIGQIFMIALIQTLFEAYLDTEKRTQQIKIVNIACIIGSLYLLLQFIFTYIFKELSAFVKLPF
jgi:hypothetical protein